ncbi:MAG: IPT/TIG domain-containing protein, partial [Gaiellaceae bacterium]
VEPLILRKFAPSQATVGSRVTLQGKGLAATKSVHFGDVKAHYKIVSDTKLVATVPLRAKSGPIVVTSALKQVRTRTSFLVLQ